MLPIGQTVGMDRSAHFMVEMGDLLDAVKVCDKEGPLSSRALGHLGKGLLLSGKWGKAEKQVTLSKEACLKGIAPTPAFKNAGCMSKSREAAMVSMLKEKSMAMTVPPEPVASAKQGKKDPRTRADVEDRLARAYPESVDQRFQLLGSEITLKKLIPGRSGGSKNDLLSSIIAPRKR